MNTLYVGFIAGVFGMAYFVYGKRQSKVSAMIAGAMLCIYPYFIDSLVWLCVVGGLTAHCTFLNRLLDAPARCASYEDFMASDQAKLIVRADRYTSELRQRSSAAQSCALDYSMWRG